MTGILGLVTGGLCFFMCCALFVVFIVTHFIKHSHPNDKHVELQDETTEKELN